MNSGMAYAHESHFGPPSKPVSIAGFIQALEEVNFETGATSSSQDFYAPGESMITQAWNTLHSDTQEAASSECSVMDIKSTLDSTWSNPRLAAHILRSHGDFIGSIYESADRSNKRKRKRGNVVDPEQEHPEVTTFQRKLDDMHLGSWPLALNSALFIRAPKNSDRNALSEIKRTSDDTLPTPPSLAAVITISIHARISWSPSYLSRSSTHIVLSHQTLGDLVDIIPCPSNEIPAELVEDDEVVGYDKKRRQKSTGVALCVEGMVYGDRMSENDYAEKLLGQLEKLPLSKRPQVQRGPKPMHETHWSSLSLRINQPYWLLHQGNCEHFLVVDQIRSSHPSDAPSGYPLTTQLTPTLLPLCRSCTKVPAVWSIVGDIRLEESPCVLCAPCWRCMGMPAEEDGVLVVPLSKHEFAS